MIQGMCKRSSPLNIPPPHPRPSSVPIPRKQGGEKSYLWGTVCPLPFLHPRVNQSQNSKSCFSQHPAGGALSSCRPGASWKAQQWSGEGCSCRMDCCSDGSCVDYRAPGLCYPSQQPTRQIKVGRTTAGQSTAASGALPLAFLLASRRGAHSSHLCFASGS